ncbi:uncharacterized protein ASCRUDRAFT_68159 [Ascoidea rubescens DSM 1968]|uniref:Rho-GAP domain-containing protein n=1 Tax=Ascoidea rubescens DSM 1968 TaxID=1344418 RepID=A0A1D2VRD2_9ASCO|nr:hypothetical protein ASCRUDRAFT_68159 [Ascoidea rubescens DSM 1968]ODV64138.1 hypothetical protein ASCRUDRAFT_68159 [Ascoidea rubescens DSM 1968]
MSELDINLILTSISTTKDSFTKPLNKLSCSIHYVTLSIPIVHCLRNYHYRLSLKVPTFLKGLIDFIIYHRLKLVHLNLNAAFNVNNRPSFASDSLDKVQGNTSPNLNNRKVIKKIKKRKSFQFNAITLTTLNINTVGNNNNVLDNMNIDLHDLSISQALNLLLLFLNSLPDSIIPPKFASKLINELSNNTNSNSSPNANTSPNTYSNNNKNNTSPTNIITNKSSDTSSSNFYSNLLSYYQSSDYSCYTNLIINSVGDPKINLQIQNFLIFSICLLLNDLPIQNLNLFIFIIKFISYLISINQKQSQDDPLNHSTTHTKDNIINSYILSKHFNTCFFKNPSNINLSILILKIYIDNIDFLINWLILIDQNFIKSNKLYLIESKSLTNVLNPRLNYLIQPKIPIINFLNYNKNSSFLLNFFIPNIVGDSISFLYNNNNFLNLNDQALLNISVNFSKIISDSNYELESIETHSSNLNFLKNLFYQNQHQSINLNNFNFFFNIDFNSLNKKNNLNLFKLSSLKSHKNLKSSKRNSNKNLNYLQCNSLINCVDIIQLLIYYLNSLPNESLITQYIFNIFSKELLKKRYLYLKNFVSQPSNENVLLSISNKNHLINLDLKVIIEIFLSFAILIFTKYLPQKNLNLLIYLIDFLSNYCDISNFDKLFLKTKINTLSLSKLFSPFFFKFSNKSQSNEKILILRILIDNISYVINCLNLMKQQFDNHNLNETFDNVVTIDVFDTNEQQLHKNSLNNNKNTTDTISKLAYSKVPLKIIEFEKNRFIGMKILLPQLIEQCINFLNENKFTKCEKYFLECQLHLHDDDDNEDDEIYHDSNGNHIDDASNDDSDDFSLGGNLMNIYSRENKKLIYFNNNIVNILFNIFLSGDQSSYINNDLLKDFNICFEIMNIINAIEENHQTKTNEQEYKELSLALSNSKLIENENKPKTKKNTNSFKLIKNFDVCKLILKYLNLSDKPLINNDIKDELIKEIFNGDYSNLIEYIDEIGYKNLNLNVKSKNNDIDIKLKIEIKRILNRIVCLLIDFDESNKYIFNDDDENDDVPANNHNNIKSNSNVNPNLNLNLNIIIKIIETLTKLKESSSYNLSEIFLKFFFENEVDKFNLITVNKLENEDKSYKVEILKIIIKILIDNFEFFLMAIYLLKNKKSEFNDSKQDSFDKYPRIKFERIKWNRSNYIEEELFGDNNDNNNNSTTTNNNNSTTTTNNNNGGYYKNKSISNKEVSYKYYCKFWFKPNISNYENTKGKKDNNEYKKFEILINVPVIIHKSIEFLVMNGIEEENEDIFNDSNECDGYEESGNNKIELLKGIFNHREEKEINEIEDINISYEIFNYRDYYFNDINNNLISNKEVLKVLFIFFERNRNNRIIDKKFENRIINELEKREYYEMVEYYKDFYEDEYNGVYKDVYKDINKDMNISLNCNYELNVKYKIVIRIYLNCLTDLIIDFLSHKRLNLLIYVIDFMKKFGEEVSRDVVIDKFYKVIFNDNYRGVFSEEFDEVNEMNEIDELSEINESNEMSEIGEISEMNEFDYSEYNKFEDNERRSLENERFLKKLVIRILIDNFNYFIGNLYLRDIEINGNNEESYNNNPNANNNNANANANANNNNPNNLNNLNNLNITNNSNSENKIISRGFSREEFSFLDEFIINSELPSYEEVINNNNNNNNDNNSTGSIHN